jgi:hypothetical protein
MNDPLRRYEIIALSSFSDADITSEPIELSEFDGPALMQLSWTGLAGDALNTPTFTVEQSVDKAQWDTVSTTTMTSAMAAAGGTAITLDILHAQYYRLKVLAADVTEGLVKALGTFKGRTRP